MQLHKLTDMEDVPWTQDCAQHRLLAVPSPYLGLSILYSRCCVLCTLPSNWSAFWQTLHHATNGCSIEYTSRNSCILLQSAHRMRFFFGTDPAWMVLKVHLINCRFVGCCESQWHAKTYPGLSYCFWNSICHVVIVILTNLSRL